LTQVGRFQLVRELGRGSFGIVFLADDPRLGRQVAIKVPLPNALVDPRLRERFVREARAAAGLDHPNVVPVYEAGEAGPVCYIAAAYCPGVNLADWLRQRREAVPLHVGAKLLAAVADAVQHAHDRGILHRDLKPSNILLMPAAQEHAEAGAGDLPFIPRLTDFGLAKLLECDTKETASGVIMGTPPYLAPEQAGGSGTLAAPTDVYSLGIILYELLTRRLPFGGSNLLLTLEQIRSQDPPPPRRFRPDLPRDLETICLKCLHKEPQQRYASAAALARDLRHFLRGEPIEARPVSLLGRARAWCQRPERVRDAGVVALLFGITTIVNAVIGLVVVALGMIVPSKDAPGVLQHFGISLCILAVPLLWVGWHTLARQRSAIWAGPVVAPTYTIYLVSLGAFHSAGEGIGSREPLLRSHLAGVILILLAAQFVAALIALVAYRANRDLPSFVPPFHRRPR
jgi:hypothetical protein